MYKTGTGFTSGVRRYLSQIQPRPLRDVWVK